MQNVFVVPVGGKYLLHAPLHRLSALVNQSAIAPLLDEKALTDHKAIRELQGTLAEPPSATLPSLEEALPPRFIGLLTTRSCNLRCSYCAFGAASATSQPMEPEMASGAVDWMARQNQDRGQRILNVHFFGGEPFCAPEALLTAVHKARMIARDYGQIPCFEVATNGVFDESWAEFAGDYIDTIVLSFDGPAEVHNRHRTAADGKGSFETVATNARRLGQSPTQLCFRTCIVHDTVSRMAEFADWFCREFQPAMVTFEPMQNSHEAARTGLATPDPWAFAVQWVAASRILRQHGAVPVYAAAVGEPRWSFCPVGTDTPIVSPDGRVSSCYLPVSEWRARDLDLDIGQADPNGEIELNHTRLADLRQLAADKPRCQRCYCRWSCAGGCHVNHSYPGCSSDYDDFCIETRIITACELLHSLGCEDIVDELLTQREAMERLAFNQSDRLADWSGPTKA